MVSSDHRKGRAAVYLTQYVASVTQCTNDGKVTTTYIVHTMVSLYHRMVVEATRSNPCDFTIPRSHFTQQYTACAPSDSVSSVGNSRLHSQLGMHSSCMHVQPYFGSACECCA